MARILLVDDEPSLRDTVGALLKYEGHQVYPIADGFEAIQMLQSLQEFDLMLADLRMAPVDGLEVIEAAKREKPTMDIIVVSAYLDDEMIRKIMSLGVTDYVDKPFSLNDILDPVRETLLKRTKNGFGSF